VKLYNTLHKKIETVTPLAGEETKKIGLYACGPTVYDFTHLGHLRKYTMDDVLVRALRAEGFELNFVQNITDVGHLTSDGDTGEDKLEKGAKKYNKTVWEVAKEFEEYFWKSMDAMNITRPDVSCRATDHIEQQLNMVLELEKKGYTYVIENDGVYFDTSKFEDYGKMAGFDIEKQKEGARLEVVEGKRNPTDFALWKFERPGEDRAMVWPSPWSERSFPGWHIECSAMACHYLGEQFEIHTGGIDHIPVHHTNEIAQAEAAFGKSPFVKYWVHHNFLQIEGEKMSKSLGNVFNIDDILEKGFNPMVLRMLFLTTHYRSEMNFTWENLTGMQKAHQRLINQLAVLLAEADAASDIERKNIEADQPKKEDYLIAFKNQISNDLNTAEALAVLWDVVKSTDLRGGEKLELITAFDHYLGLDLLETAQKKQEWQGRKLPEEIQEMTKKRAAARAAKDWQTSDAIRDQIIEMGYTVEDYGEKQVVTKLS
jgi:cysteinyl-tRNA synthetase